MRKPVRLPAEKNGGLESIFGEHGTVRVSFDISYAQFSELLASMGGPIKVKGQSRTMLDLEQVLKIVPVSKSTLQRRLAAGAFPSGHFISPNRRVWYEDEILNWQDNLNSPISDRKKAERRKPKRAAVPKKKRARRS